MSLKILKKFKILDLTRNVSLNNLLGLIFYVHCAFLVFNIITAAPKLNPYIEKCSTSSTGCPSLWLIVLRLFLSAFITTLGVIILGLAFAVKQYTSAFLRLYCWLAVIVNGVAIPFRIYTHLTSFKGTTGESLSVLLYLVNVVIVIFIMTQVYLIKRKIEGGSFLRSLAGHLKDEDNPDQNHNLVKAVKMKMIKPHCLMIHTKIGEGHFSTVYKGTLNQNWGAKLNIAAKVLKNWDGDDDPQMFQIFLDEIKIALVAGDHLNIVQFHGISTNECVEDQFAMITEFCSGGNLRDFLKENETSLRSKDKECISELVGYATQILAGIKHLASQKIIHGDLAARNVLLTKDFTAKLTDFGLSFKLREYETYIRLHENEAALPWRWMALETLKDLKFSHLSDIFSFGVVVWEIFSLGNIPHAGISWSTDFLKMLENGFVLDKPEFTPDALYKEMKSCWNVDPERRPGVDHIQSVLRNMLII